MARNVGASSQRETSQKHDGSEEDLDDEGAAPGDEKSNVGEKRTRGGVKGPAELSQLERRRRKGSRRKRRP